MDSSRRLHISWGLGNELHMVDVLPISSLSAPGSSGSSSRESTASVVHWGAQGPAQRRIAYDSLGLFQQLQQRAPEPLSPEAWSQTMQYSRTVSTVLAPDGVRGVEVTAVELAILQERALWDLLSLFFLEGGGGGDGGGEAGSGGASVQHGTQAQDLSGWLRRHAVAACGSVAAQPLPPALAAQLREAALPEAAPQYWPTVQRLAALGWLDEVVELLGLHSAWMRYDGSTAGGDDDAARSVVGGLEAVTLLLRRFPTLSGGGGGGGGTAGRQFDSLPELLQYRRTWQAQCASLLQADAPLLRQCASADAATAAGLQGVLGVLAGEEASLEAAAAHWLELLVAQLTHVYPAATPQAQLRQLLQRCLEQHAPPPNSSDRSEFLDVAAAALEACSELDVQAVMRVCSSYCSDWFMAHAPALMAAHPAGAGVLGRELRHLGGSQREFYCLEYCSALMLHPPTWPLAAAYLAWCPAHGQPALAALLRRLPLDASDGGGGGSCVARKAVQVAQHQGMTRTAQDVRRLQGVLCWQAGLLGAALSWLAQCGDVQRVDTALQPLAAAVSDGRQAGDGAGEGEGSPASALEVLQPLLESLPPGSSNAALLAVHRLLRTGGGGGPDGGQAAGAFGGAGTSNGAGSGSGMHAAVQALEQLPASMRDGCLQLVCAALPLLAPGELQERDVPFLLQWLLSAEARLPVGPQGQAAAASIQVARLALVRSLAASHMTTADLQQQQPAAAARAAAAAALAPPRTMAS